jgi:hypothetical protein
VDESDDWSQNDTKSNESSEWSDTDDEKKWKQQNSLMLTSVSLKSPQNNFVKENSIFMLCLNISSIWVESLNQSCTCFVLSWDMFQCCWFLHKTIQSLARIELDP